jgi:mercuric ion transport protein
MAVQQVAQTQAQDTATTAPRERATTLLSVGSILAAVGASSCCVVPFALFTLGISGAWIANLTALAPYQPIFVAITLAFLAGGFFVVYRRPKAACADGTYCARPISGRIAKAGLWTATVLVAVALAFPYVVPLFLES